MSDGMHVMIPLGEYNELINENEYFKEEIDRYQYELRETTVYLDKLEKALDKACEFIGYNFDCPYATINQCTLDDRCSDDYKECWKEWLLDEVKE